MPLKVSYYSDVLCVWAWIAQRRLEELKEEFGTQIQLDSHYVNVFGSTALQIGEKWASRGGFEGFGQHVIAAAAPFPDAPVKANLWQEVRPCSSTPAHVMLKAVEITHSSDVAESFAKTLREQFFTAAVDIGRAEVLLELAMKAELDTNQLSAVLDSGAAMAEVMQDYQMAQTQGIKGSPSWVLDDGRQILYGNVGFRVLRANTAELLQQPGGEASWC